MEAERCTVCGCTDTKLIDGFYYCVECNTQNKNVREQLLEEKALADGTFAQSTKRKIVRLKEDKIEMSGEWHKWHTFNFIIAGLADELIALGAKPTFKMKLLWIWTRYIKKYQNKEELIRNNISQDDDNQTALNTFLVEEDQQHQEGGDQNQPEGDNEIPHSVSKRKDECDIPEGSNRDIKLMTKGVIVAMFYVALNLDESEIQLSQLYRFVEDKYLNISNVMRFIPDDIDLKKVPGWYSFGQSTLQTQYRIRAVAMSLLRKLDLGTPKVPNLRKIADNFITELCLPNDFKQFVYSLMHYRKCEFLDIDNRVRNCSFRFPDYEGTVMTYILVAIKICFGLDGVYESKLSDVVDKINNERRLPKSLRIGKYSDSTERLFSFREWCNYLQFRKIMLCKFNLKIAERYCLGIDDYVYFEHTEERPKRNEELPDKITMDLIGRIPLEQEIGVIPKHLFVPSLTPLSDYTDVIVDYCQDPEIKMQLAEDFKRYSLKYACENLELLDSDRRNIITGVSEDGKTRNNLILGTITIKKAKTKMVYVKNCENRNWLKTKPPTIEHMTCEDEDNDRESDHGYDSEITSKEKESECIVDEGLTDVSMADQIIHNEENSNDDTELSPDSEIKSELIQEEEADKNIFDDCFEDIDFKEECERQSVIDAQANDDGDDGNDQIFNDIPDEDFDCRSDISVMPEFNPDTFDREGTIRELILFACKKYKIPIPAEYRPLDTRKRRERPFGEDNTSAKRSKKSAFQGKVTVQELLNNYYNNIQNDFATKVQQQLALIRNTDLDHIQNNMEIVERNANVGENESGLNSPVPESERHSINGHTDQQNLDETNRTDVNDKTCEIDETLERTLFEDEDEMVLEDPIPKGDPKFDEKDHDISQLYIKLKKEEPEDVFDVKDDTTIDEIINKKIEECKNGTVFVDLETEATVTECLRKKVDSDSEDEVPLSVIREEILQIEELYRKEDDYEQLVKKDLPQFKYWVRHYQKDFMVRSYNWHTKFDEELKENTPASFFFVIKECSSILNCTNFYLYKNMQIIEDYLMQKAKGNKKKAKTTGRVAVRDKDVMEDSSEMCDISETRDISDMRDVNDMRDSVVLQDTDEIHDSSSIISSNAMKEGNEIRGVLHHPKVLPTENAYDIKSA